MPAKAKACRRKEDARNQGFQVNAKLGEDRLRKRYGSVLLAFSVMNSKDFRIEIKALHT